MQPQAATRKLVRWHVKPAGWLHFWRPLRAFDRPSLCAGKVGDSSRLVLAIGQRMELVK